MNIYSRLALLTTQSSALLATLGALGTITPAFAANLTFEISGNLVDPSVNFSQPPVSGTFTGTFSYDSEAEDLQPENPNIGEYSISEFSLIFRNLSGNQIGFADSDDEACNCLTDPPTNTGYFDYDFASLIINPNNSIELNFSDQESGGTPFYTGYIYRRVNLDFAYEGATEVLPSTTEEFLANVGSFVSYAPEFGRIQTIYEVELRRSGGPFLYSTSATISAASQSVPEPSGIGALSLLGLGFFLKKRGTVLRKAKVRTKV